MTTLMTTRLSPPDQLLRPWERQEDAREGVLWQPTPGGCKNDNYSDTDNDNDTNTDNDDDTDNDSDADNDNDTDDFNSIWI